MKTKLIQISNHIYKLSIETTLNVPIIINTWYIIEENQVYIIDTGMAFYAEKQIKVAQLLGNPQAIFLTHGHTDHIGGAKLIADSLNIPIYSHENEIPYINGSTHYLNKDDVEETGIEFKVQPFKKLLNLPFVAYLTPGHSPGHVVYYHNEDKTLISGDLFISNVESLHPPINKFTYDMTQNIEHGKIIDEIKPNLISTSHGKDIIYSEDIYQIYKFKYENI